MTNRELLAYNSAIAEVLITNGYEVLPINWGEKRCLVTGWSTTTFTSEWWLKQTEVFGVGVKTTNCIGVDIDCLVPEISNAMIHYLFNEYGLAPVRYGRWPKLLVVYQFQAQHVDRNAHFGIHHKNYVVGLRKFKSQIFNSAKPIGAENTTVESITTNLVEVLGFKQMFAAYTLYNSDTMDWYNWSLSAKSMGGIKGILEVPVTALPTLNALQCHNIIKHFESLAITSDLLKRKRGKKGSCGGGEWTNSALHSAQANVAARVAYGDSLADEKDQLQLGLPDQWVVDALVKENMIIQVKENGLKLEIVCPWFADHTDQDQTGTMYCRPVPKNGEKTPEPILGGFGSAATQYYKSLRGKVGYFNCLHASCEAKEVNGRKKFIEWLKNRGHKI